MFEYLELHVAKRAGRWVLAGSSTAFLLAARSLTFLDLLHAVRELGCLVEAVKRGAVRA